MVRSLALTLPDGSVVGHHVHPWSQLIYAARGVMTVSGDRGAWVVPSHRAIWMPADIGHTIETTGTTTLRTLYVRPDLTKEQPRASCVIDVPPLLRELILHVLMLGHLLESDASHVRLTGVLLDLLNETPQVALDLANPVDVRARRIADRILARPGANEPLEGLAQGSGAGLRTLERIFKRETGLTLGKWRQRARLIHALRKLAAGATVEQAARAVGNESTSAFIAIFKRELGMTPGKSYDRIEHAGAPSGRYNPSE